MLAGNRGVFHPLHLTPSVLKAWWAADDLADGVIQNWPDRMTGLVMAQATSGQRPLKASTSFNSAYPGVTFDGIDDNLGVTTLTALPTGSTPGEIWCIGTNTGLVSVLSIPVVVGTGAAASRRHQASTLALLGIAAVNDGTAANSSLVPWTSPLIVKGDWSGTAMNCFVNGVPTASNPATIATLNTNNTRARIGSSSNASPSNFWTGPIRHVVVAQGVLSTTLRQKMEGWFAWDSGLQSALPNSHPFKLFRP